MPRRYVQRVRAEAAQQTRRAILDAARTVLLGEAGLELAVGAVAAEAGVARSTVYTAFESRAGLLAALANETLERAGLAEVIAQYRNPDAVEALERSLRASCRMYASEYPVLARLVVLAAVDPEAAAPLARSQQDRARGMADLAERLEAQGRLRPDLDVHAAADILWLLTGFGSFDELHSGRGLSADATADRLLRIARGVVIAEA